MIRTNNCHSDSLSDNTHWGNKNTSDCFIFQNPSTAAIDLKFYTWGQCNWVTYRLFHGDLTHWLQGLNSLEMTCVEGIINTVNVNSVQKHDFRVLWRWCNLVAKSLQGVWTFPVHLNPMKCTKFFLYSHLFCSGTATDPKKRDNKQCLFYFTICIFPKFLEKGKRGGKLVDTFYNYLIYFWK